MTSARAIRIGLIFSLLSAVAAAQTIVQRVRLGHSLEDITAVGGNVVVLDGSEVYEYSQKKDFKKLFDLRDAGIYDHLTGMTYIDPEGLYAFVRPPEGAELILLDRKGRPAGNRPIVYPNGYVPGHVEGLEYLRSGPYADHMALVTYELGDFTLPRIEILARDGRVVREIVPSLPGPWTGFVAAATSYGELLLVLANPNLLYRFDYDGNAIDELPTVFPDCFNAEGLVQLADGRVAMSDYYTGKVVFADADLNRLPAQDLRNRFGLELGPALGLGWHASEGRYLVLGGQSYGLRTTVETLTPDLADHMMIAQPSAQGFSRTLRGATFVGGGPDDLVAVGHRGGGQGPKELVLFDLDGVMRERIDLDAIGRPTTATTYIPDEDQFALRTMEQPSLLRIVDRAGNPVRDLDLYETAGITNMGGLAYHHPLYLPYPGGASFMVWAFVDGAGWRLVKVAVTDGALQGTWDLSAWRLGNVLGLTAITAAPWDTFALVGSENNELVVFRLP